MNDTTMLHEGFITTKEASRLFKYTPSYLAHLIRIKKIQAHRLGRSWLIEKNTLLHFIEHRGKEDIKIVRPSTHSNIPQEHTTHRASIGSVAVPLPQPHTVANHRSVFDDLRIPPPSEKWIAGAFVGMLLVLGAHIAQSSIFSQSIHTLQTFSGNSSRIPLALGEFVIAATHAVIAADVALAYGIAAAAPATAQVTVQILISIGDTLSSATAHIPAQVASVLAYSVK